MGTGRWCLLSTWDQCILGQDLSLLWVPWLNIGRVSIYSAFPLTLASGGPNFKDELRFMLPKSAPPQPSWQILFLVENTCHLLIFLLLVSQNCDSSGSPPWWHFYSSISIAHIYLTQWSEPLRPDFSNKVPVILLKFSYPRFILSFLLM